jgi:uncharacterized protein
MIKKHPLTEIFPEFAEKINHLKEGHEEFKELYREYDELDEEIFTIESEVDSTFDDILSQLQLEQERIKEEIYELLTSED